MRAVAPLAVVGALIAGCADPAPEANPSASQALDELEPPTTFEDQPESLTTVPDEVIPTTEPPTTTVTTPPRSGITAADLCAGAALVEPTPLIDTDLLPETSGIAYSRTHPDRMYAHNDSGNLPRLYGIGASSTVDFVWSIDAALLDWEDMAVAGPTLYLADIGDNLHLRPTVRILRLAEPDGFDATLQPPEIFSFTYEDERYDAETLIVEPDGTGAVIVTKGLDAPATIFELPLDDPPTDPPVLAPVGGLSLGLITAGDITADGAVVGLRQPDRILLWDREPGASIAETIQLDTFCVAPSVEERQGEAFAFHPDGRGYTTLSERESATRNDFRLDGP
ncbi:MAG: hypothetical protein AAGA90_04575 [Actinomycetota bacterium]